MWRSIPGHPMVSLFRIAVVRTTFQGRLFIDGGNPLREIDLTPYRS